MQVIQGLAYDGKAADVWSLGVTLCTMLAGYLPFQGESEASILVGEARRGKAGRQSEEGKENVRKHTGKTHMHKQGCESTKSRYRYPCLLLRVSSGLYLQCLTYLRSKRVRPKFDIPHLPSTN